MTSPPTKPRKVAFILPPPNHGTLEKPTWRSVSIRVRCTEIAQWLGRYGTQVHLVIDESVAPRLADGSLDGIDLFVILQTLSDHTDLVDALLAAGKCVVTDVCDDVSRYEGLLARSWENARKAAAITVPTRWLADRLGPLTDRPIHLVHDAVEGPPHRIRGPAPDGPLHLFWYGWQHKVGVVQRRLDRLRAYAHRRRPIELTVMSDLYGIRDEMATVLAAGDDRLTIRGEHWSMEGFDAEMARADIALIPFDTKIDFSGRSPLKLMQALWQGRLAVSEDLESYPDFAPFGVLHGDIVDGIDHMTADPDRALADLSRAQHYIRDTYMPSVLAHRWQAVLGEILTEFQKPR
ncbi:MAG: hypothetical protein P1U88_19855 [Thalassobaculaceae bacterium]|nr:hypothetical protein [Thalassobaculaceae bacterium]